MHCFPVPAGSHCAPARGSCSDASSHALGTISSIRLVGSLTRADHQPIFVVVEIAVVLQSFLQVQVIATSFSLSAQHCPNSRPDPDPFIAAENLSGLQNL